MCSRSWSVNFDAQCLSPTVALPCRRLSCQFSVAVPQHRFDGLLLLESPSLCLTSDVGVEATTYLLDELKKAAKRDKLLQYAAQVWAIHSGGADERIDAADTNERRRAAALRPFVEQADWLLAEAFCQYKDREVFKPYEKNHSTVKEASELASVLGVKNLVLYHTEDKHLAARKAEYTAEAQQYYQGNVFVPDDLDEIIL